MAVGDQDLCADHLDIAVNEIFVPEATRRKMVGSPSIFPTTLTALAGRISFPRLTGVRPKKMQNALPGGQ